VTKVIAFISRLPGMSREEFLQHWQVDHPPYVWALPGVRRYVQNAAVDGYREWPHDGVAELWFDSVGDVARAFASDAAGPMHRHEELFVTNLTWMLAEEIELQPGSCSV